jgi:hypothetical protein
MVDTATPDQLRETLAADKFSASIANVFAKNATFLTEEQVQRELPALYAERKAGGVTTMTSGRIKNLKINWREVAFAIAPVVVVALVGEPVSAVLEGVRALATIGGLTQIQVGEVEAKVVLYLWSIRRDEQDTQVRDISAALSEVDAPTLNRAFARLETLGAIKLSDDKRIASKIETIVFV